MLGDSLARWLQAEQTWPLWGRRLCCALEHGRFTWRFILADWLVKRRQESRKRLSVLMLTTPRHSRQN